MDLSFLNADDRPAGRHGLVKVDSDRLVFEDGTPARFWGANLRAPSSSRRPGRTSPGKRDGWPSLATTSCESCSTSRTGSNPTSRRRRPGHPAPRPPLARSARLLDQVPQGRRHLRLAGHALSAGAQAGGRRLAGPGRDRPREEQLLRVQLRQPELMDLMKEFQHQYLSHVNRYTGLAYKDDPAVVGVLITNENDLTFHFGWRFCPTTIPVHQALFDRESWPSSRRRACLGTASGGPGSRARASTCSTRWSTSSTAP